MSELVINCKKDKWEICVLEKGEICELYLIDKESDGGNIVGNIYSGVVRNVVDGMQAAFIDIGKGKNAFLSLKDAVDKVDITKEVPNLDCKISDIWKENQKILVQVKKRAIADKGPRVSTHITIPGNYVVLMPKVNIITISQKITNEKEKNRLLKIVKNTLPEGFGMIIRTDAENISEEGIIQDIQELIKKWQNITSYYEKSQNIELLYDEHEITSKIGRELITKKLNHIYVNDKKMRDDLAKIVQAKGEHENLRIELIDVPDLAEEFGLITQMADSEKKKIWLNCGGYIVIDKTEALTAIDVNSGKYIGDSNLETTALEVNKEAAYEIMKQIRLKDISGIIVVDYIDLQKREDQEQIIEIMQNEAHKDRSKIDIKGYTKLNLVELTRKMINM